MLLSFLGGASGAIGFPAYQSMLPDLVEREDLLAAVSLSSAQWNMGRVLGPALAGIILVVWSPAAAFWINAASFSAVIVALCFVPLPHRVRRRRGRGPGRGLREGAAAAMEEPGCRSAVILISIVALIGSPFIGLIAAMAINGLHQQLGGPAVLTTAQGIGAVIGALSLAPLAHALGQRRVVTAALFAFCLCLVLYGASPGSGLAALGDLPGGSDLHRDPLRPQQPHPAPRPRGARGRDPEPLHDGARDRSTPSASSSRERSARPSASG